MVVLHVFDENFKYKGRVKDWIDMSWVEEKKGEGKFTLVTYDTDKYASLLQKGRFFYRADRPCAMMAVKVERKTEKNQITVNGYTTLHMLTRRVVAYPYESTSIEDGIYGLIGENLRGLKNVSCAASKGLPGETDFKIEGTGLLYGVFSLLNESDYGIRMLFDYKNKKHIVEVYEGVDRTFDPKTGGTVFSQEFGNLRNLTVSEDDDLYANVAYVTGAAANDPQTIYYQYVSPEAGDDEANWRELLVQGESQKADQDYGEWQAQQRQRGKEALNDHRSALAFEVDMSPEQFGKKFDLADKVTCKSRRYGLMFNTSISEYKYSYKKGKEVVKLTLGNKPTDYVRSEVIKHG